MRYLLDTRTLIWALTNPDRLPGRVRDMLVDRANQVLFSTASIWEIAIKASLGRVTFTAEPQAILSEALQAGFSEVPIDSRTALRVAELPFHHRDPFDRLIVAQAMAMPARLLTADRALTAYSELVDLC